MKINQIIVEDRHSKAYNELKSGMEKWMNDIWERCDPADCDSLSEYTGATDREIYDDIEEKWLPLFKNSTDALIQALYKIQDIYEGTVISDFCLQYLQVLGAE